MLGGCFQNFQFHTSFWKPRTPSWVKGTDGKVPDAYCQRCHMWEPVMLAATLGSDSQPACAKARAKTSQLRKNTCSLCRLLILLWGFPVIREPFWQKGPYRAPKPVLKGSLKEVPNYWKRPGGIMLRLPTLTGVDLYDGLGPVNLTL